MRVRQLVSNADFDWRMFTAPGRACEDDSVLGEFREARLDDLKTVSLDEPDLVGDFMDLSIVLGALENLRILLNSEDALPAASHGESDSIAPGTSEGVDENRLVSGQSMLHLLGNLARISINGVRDALSTQQMSYLATGCGVTPNQASSVIQTP